MANVLHTEYRPKTFDEVIGQDAVCRSLKRALGDNSGHAFALVGPSGVGKTTLARIAAKQLGVITPSDYNAAVNTGVEEMRLILDSIYFRPLDGGARAIIIDEAHRLSANAWDSMLKPVEEPPPWVYWFFCTTNGKKIPKTIKTRCLWYELKPVSTSDLIRLLDDVADAEGILKSREGGAIIEMVAREAHGSPRQALTLLAACAGAKSKDEAAEIIRSAEIVDKEAFELARALVDGRPWRDLMEITKALGDADPESVRRIVSNYVSKVCQGASDKSVGRVLQILEAFSHSFEHSEGTPPLVLAVGRAYFAE